MKKSCAWMAVGIVVLATSLSRGQETGVAQQPAAPAPVVDQTPMPPTGDEGKEPQAPPAAADQQQPAAPAAPAAPTAPAAPAEGCCPAPHPKVYLSIHDCHLPGWLCYRPARTPCCSQSCGAYHPTPPLYTFFLDQCPQGHGSCCTQAQATQAANQPEVAAQQARTLPATDGAQRISFLSSMSNGLQLLSGERDHSRPVLPP